MFCVARLQNRSVSCWSTVATDASPKEEMPATIMKWHLMAVL